MQIAQRNRHRSRNIVWCKIGVGQVAVYECQGATINGLSWRHRRERLLGVLGDQQQFAEIKKLSFKSWTGTFIDRSCLARKRLQKVGC